MQTEKRNKNVELPMMLLELSESTFTKAARLGLLQHTFLQHYIERYPAGMRIQLSARTDS